MTLYDASWSKTPVTPPPQLSTLRTKPGYNINPLKSVTCFLDDFSFENINYMILESNRNVCSSNPFMQAKRDNPSRLPVFYTNFFSNTNYMICESQTEKCVHLILSHERSEPTHPINLFFRLTFF